MIPEDLQRLFDTPDPSFGPTPLWWWSGEPVTRERLEWQLRRYHDGGINNLVIINLAPAGPTYGAPPDNPAWFSEEWWDRLRDTCDIMSGLGMKLWFYDQIGFSGANLQGAITRLHPFAQGQRLQALRQTVNNGRISIPPEHTLLDVYASGRRVDTTPEGGIPLPDGTDVLAVTTRQTAFDYLNPQAVELLLDRVHREFDRRVPEYLGDVIVGSFQDELPNTNAWTPAFPDVFRAECGYDLMEVLPALFEGTDRESAKIRTDYYRVRTGLTERALFRPLHRWHEERNLLLGADQTNPARAGYPIQSTQMYTDYFRTHRWINAVGSDHQGDAKVHSSLARLYGHSRVWIEAFHSSGWGGTLEETWDWLIPFLRSGANLYNPHATYYSTVAGWFEWAPPSTDWRQPYWPHYRQFADAVARVASIMSWGTYQAQVAVLHPTTAVQAGVPIDTPIEYFSDMNNRPALPEDLHETEVAQTAYLDLCGSTNWFNPLPGQLDLAGIAFDVIDDDSIQRGSSSQGYLRVAQQAYSTIILPHARVLEEETARALLAFMEAGGRVLVVGSPPSFAAGRDGDDGMVSAVAQHPGCTMVRDAGEAVSAIGRGRDVAFSDVPLLVRHQGDTGFALVSGAFPGATSWATKPESLGHRRERAFDRNAYAQCREVTVRASIDHAEVWDPVSGERRPAAFRTEGDVSVITVDPAGAPAVLLLWHEGEQEASPATEPSSKPPLTTIDVSDGWTGTLRPTLDNTWGDLARPAGGDIAKPQIWSMEWREAGTPEWTPIRASFGQRVLIHTADSAIPALNSEECADIAQGEQELADERWQRWIYSGSRGLERSGRHMLGNKGLVPSEFVICKVPAGGGPAHVRTILFTPHRGPADLIVAATADTRVWWNGEALPLANEGFVQTWRVTVTREANVLEYHMASVPEDDQGPIRSYFTLAPPRGFSSRPEYMVSSDPQAGDDGRIDFEAPIPHSSDLIRATLIVGAATSLAIVIDGKTIARQEKVEYYEGSGSKSIQYFRHDVTSYLHDSGHTLQIQLESSDPSDGVFVDLLLERASGPKVLHSGTGWSARSSGRVSETKSVRVKGAAQDHAYAAQRPHPLPGAHWLRGEPVVGTPVLAFEVSDSTRKRAQEFRVMLPAGTVYAELPLKLPAAATLDGVPVDISNSHLRLDHALQRPGILHIRTIPTPSLRGGAAWAGPIAITHHTAPITLGSWHTLGLSAWSGGITYSRRVAPGQGIPWTLDLGDLRGTVEVSVDGRVVHQRFCGPYRFAMEPVDGEVTLEITIYNTLGPFLRESTPTEWVDDAQIPSGLFGPVTISL